MAGGDVSRRGMAGSQMGAGVVKVRRARWQGRKGMVGAGGPDDSCWGWWGRRRVAEFQMGAARGVKPCLLC